EDLRCSKAQVYKLMNGEIADRTVLPHIALGRKKVVRRSSLEAWKRLNENRCHSLGRLRNEGRGRCELRSHMRQRFQNGCVRKSKDGYWVGQWREDGKLFLGKVTKITKSTAREKLADLVKLVNERAAYTAEIDTTVKDFVERMYLPFYKRKWKESTAMTNEDRVNLRERLIVKLAVLAGMRPGEISGLRRGQIGESSAAIEQRVYRGTIDTPKTHKSKRFAALSSGLRVDMEAWLGRDPEGQPSDWL